MGSDLDPSQEQKGEETALLLYRRQVSGALYSLNALVSADGEKIRAQRKEEYNELCVLLYKAEKRELLRLLEQLKQIDTDNLLAPVLQAAALQLKVMEAQLLKDPKRHEGEELGDFVLDKEYCNKRGLTYHGVFSDIIENTRRILTEENPQTRDRLIYNHRALAQVVSGNKVLAATLMYVVGGVIVVTSILAAIASMGIASPVSVAGVVLGVSLLKGLALTGSVVAIGVGTGMGVHGLFRTCFAASKQCAPQEVLDFANHAASANATGLFSRTAGCQWQSLTSVCCDEGSPVLRSE